MFKACPGCSDLLISQSFMPSDCRADAVAWYRLWACWAALGTCGFDVCMETKESPKFPIILECWACFKKTCPNTADWSASVQMKNLLPGLAASCALPQGGYAGGTRGSGTVTGTGTVTITITMQVSCPRLDLYQASPCSARCTLMWDSTPAFMRVDLPQQKLNCEAEFMLKNVICAWRNESHIVFSLSFCAALFFILSLLKHLPAAVQAALYFAVSSYAMHFIVFLNYYMRTSRWILGVNAAFKSTHEIN